MTRQTRLCSIEGCGRKHYARGWCDIHYRRWRAHGNPYPEVPAGTRIDAHVPAHGTVNEYGNYGCRCEPCKAATAEYQKAKREQPCANGCGRMVWNQGWRVEAPWCHPCRALAATIPLEELHGTETGYSKGCRCDECRQASAGGRRARRARMSPEAREAERQRDRVRRPLRV